MQAACATALREGGVSHWRGEQQCVLARMAGARFQRRGCCFCWRASASTNLMPSCTSPTFRYSFARMCPVLCPRRRREPAVCIACVWTSRAEAVVPAGRLPRLCTEEGAARQPRIETIQTCRPPCSGWTQPFGKDISKFLYVCLLRMCAGATCRHSCLPPSYILCVWQAVAARAGGSLGGRGRGVLACGMVSSMARPEVSVQEYTRADLPRLYDRSHPLSPVPPKHEASDQNG